LNDILVINKDQRSAKRISNPSDLQKIFNVLGSNLNPILTQVAKTKKALFVEGKDFQILSKFSRILECDQVANRSNFAVIPVEGFNPQKLRAFKEGISRTIGSEIDSAVIFDRDYRSSAEVEKELKELSKGQIFAHIHSCKEIENYLINIDAIQRAIEDRILERNMRTETQLEFVGDLTVVLEDISSDFRTKVFGQLQSKQYNFEKSVSPRLDHSTITQAILEEFDKLWSNMETRFKLVPGKEFLSKLNEYLQEEYGVSISRASIINHFKQEDIPQELKELITKIDEFRQ